MKNPTYCISDRSADKPKKRKKKKGKKPSRVRTYFYDPTNDDIASYHQIEYGEYENNQPVISRVWITEDYFFKALEKHWKDPGNWYFDERCERKVCGTVTFKKHSKLEIQAIERRKMKEFNISLPRLLGFNVFRKQPSREQMLVYIHNKMWKRLSTGVSDDTLTAH